MASEIERVRIKNRTESSLEMEMHLANSEVVEIRLDSMSAGAMVKAILENGPYPKHRAGKPEFVLDFLSYGFATSPSAEGHLALVFQLSRNRFPVAIRAPHVQMAERRRRRSRPRGLPLTRCKFHGMAVHRPCRRSLATHCFAADAAKNHGIAMATEANKVITASTRSPRPTARTAT